jgi:uncharacterized protein (UPF0333 family)
MVFPDKMSTQMRTIKNQNGFSGLELVLVAVVVALVAGGGVYVYMQRQNASQNSAASTDPASGTKADPSKVTATDDKALIKSAIEADCKKDGADQKLTYFGEIDQQGDAAKVSVRCGTKPTQDGDLVQSDSGYVVMLKKTGSWAVVYKGQQQPGKDVGTKYTLPAGWYSTDY